jgi:chromate reductase, NAD(P)H dehydrogenase (quinone)
MITIVSGTNRVGSRTLQVALIYKEIFEQQGEKVNLVDLAAIDISAQNDNMAKLQNEVLFDTSKYVFVAPEYNGSFPGILKLMIDKSEIRKTMWHKKAMLVGVASGRAGNLRGLDHLTNILNYLKIAVLPNKIPFSGIESVLDAEGKFASQSNYDLATAQVQEFIKF